MSATTTLATSTTVKIDQLPEGVTRLLQMKGQICKMLTEKDCKVRKGMPGVTKISSFMCRIGCDYDNLKNVQEKRENGELPAENQGLSWGEWLVFPYIIAHKGEHYIRCTSFNSPNFIPDVKYMSNGKEITKDEAKVICLANEFSDKEKSDVFNIKINNLLELNGQPF